jgi:ATP-dependent DNA helicase 2 subunit 2
MRYVWEKIALALSANRVGVLVSVVGVRTDETNHSLDEEGYDNISVMRPLEPIKMEHLKQLQSDIRPSATDIGDAISAIVVSVSEIETKTTLASGALGKYERKIVLLTDGRGPMDGSDIEEIAQKINEVGIELVVM